ncbi:hypothetical protein N784_15555 [Pontibacillus litoralis JSM 072002]|uniref:Uncharacterized protein n=1 Tax=Pontibacillus litoralis JSM 072002 TaxID=1385512 RepID=A0A0A5G895_9BACI|nr:hypothetical protein N784_15555 [Pontibacillus litoralis JSM 072002]
MRFLDSNWFSLVISFTIAFVISIGKNPPGLTNKGLLYFGIELLILMTLCFITVKLVNFVFSLFSLR